ncbi:MAG: putative ABC transporter ATP-binding protein [Candidatus Heimdallarchaeota archaeon LC_2]|nr:MAG: putative ABC transporter ATP-binding protein [Candidatus Heimdallarchaeota archaeon LC_2]
MVRKVMLELNNVSKIFNKGKDSEIWAVNDVNLKIFQGEMVALMGPSGSGKSTLLNLIGGLTPISKGTIFVDNLDVGKMGEEKRSELRRDKIGFIFQHFNLLDFLNAEQNVMLPLLIQGNQEDIARRRSTMLLRELGLGGRLRHTPAELSGGQEQRVAIARSLITNPILILGDEPTGDLDHSSADDVLKIFRRINKEKKQTLLLVTHDPWVGNKCDRIIRIDDGKIVSTGEEN